MKETTQTRAAAAKRANILRLVLASGTAGLTMPELRKATGQPLSTVGTSLRTLRDEGRVEASQPNGGPGNRWGAPGTRAAYEARNSAALAAWAARLARRRVLASRKRDDDVESDGFARPSIARIVPAHLAEPLRPAGPRSVWALGVAA